MLFIIFEEDYRFAPEPDDPAWTHKNRSDTSSRMPSCFKPSPPPAQSSSTSSSRAEPTASSHNKIPRWHKVEPTAPQEFSGRKVRDQQGGYTLFHKPSAANCNQPSQFMRDLVAYATLAHRSKRGDFIWCGWQPHGCGESKGKIKSRYASGNMLTMVSKAGFWKLQASWDEHPSLRYPGHVDICLKNFFSKPTNNYSCYISPPLGGYSAHVSGCEAKQGVREEIWKEDFACPGTRRSHDWETPPRQKFLCSFTENGRCVFERELNVEVPDNEVRWLTKDVRAELGTAHGGGERSQREKREGRRAFMHTKFRHYVGDDKQCRNQQAFPAQ